MIYNELMTLVNTDEDTHLLFYPGVTQNDIELIEKYKDGHDFCLPETLTDYFGVSVKLKYLQLKKEFGKIDRVPYPSDRYHAEAIEYAGILKAVDEAKENLVGVELGCGFAPWISLAGVIARRHNKTFSLIGVEGSKEYYNYSIEHLTENGLIDNSVLINAVVAPFSSENAFFKQNLVAGNDWGARYSTTGGEGYEEIKTIKIKDVIEKYQLVDFIHIDVQGAEFEIINADIEVLNTKVKRLVIGTHTRFIEGQLIELLKKNKWILENEKPCHFIYNETIVNIIDMTIADGTQVWKNSHIN